MLKIKFENTLFIKSTIVYTTNSTITTTSTTYCGWVWMADGRWCSADGRYRRGPPAADALSYTVYSSILLVLLLIAAGFGW